jgi:predicted SprT family Zn-dependent metalloprotease
MDLKLPKKIKVGDRWYSVEIVETMERRATMGYVYYGTGKIEVATKSNATQRAYSNDEVSDTFWHELTHAILYDMGHNLYKDEKFVTRFANRLAKAINTAKFK